MKSSSTVTARNLPLLIDTVTIPGVKGQIGITSCPGMKDEFCYLDTYAESLNDDLLTIRNWGAIALVTLLDGSELNTLGVKELSRKAMSHNLVWLHLPIRNLSIPDEKFDEQWAWAGPRLSQWLREGHRIVIHCKEGIGRAGVVAARVGAGRRRCSGRRGRRRRRRRASPAPRSPARARRRPGHLRRLPRRDPPRAAPRPRG